MQTPLSATARTAGQIFSGSQFVVPQYQREYAWLTEQVDDFWNDLEGSLNSEKYFLGLLILTEDAEGMHVVDGQQRIITLSLLAAALYHEAIDRDRKALADRISANFLKSINYQTDEITPRVILSDRSDNNTFQKIVDFGKYSSQSKDKSLVSEKIIDSFNLLRKNLQKDLQKDPFRRLGVWTEFLNESLYFAVFVHPDPASAYQVFEVINTRGRELTTADLLKNNILSLTIPALREQRYEHWQELSGQFENEGTNNFVQYIRHVVTVYDGHVLPKNLYSFLSGRLRSPNVPPHTPDNIMRMLDAHLPLYRQMIDPGVSGPASQEMLEIFTALNSLGVLMVRPVLLAIFESRDNISGMREVLRLVVRRIVSGNLGTGNVERRFSEVAKEIHESGDWQIMRRRLRDLYPSEEDFRRQIKKRSFNKNTLGFLRRSIVQRTLTPTKEGTLHFICPRHSEDWPSMSEEDRAFWSATLANVMLAHESRRPEGASDWQGVKRTLVPEAVAGEFVHKLSQIRDWNAVAVDDIAEELANVAANIWY